MNYSYEQKLKTKIELPYFFKQYYFTCTLPAKQGEMLSFLIAMEDFVLVRLADDESYFESNLTGFIDKKLVGWSNYEIKSAIDGLVNSGYIFKRVIDNNQTFIALNHTKIDQLYNQWISDIESNTDKIIIKQR